MSLRENIQTFSPLFIPESFRPYVETVQVTNRKRCALASASFAPTYTNSELVALFPSEEKGNAEAIRTTIEATGITMRHIQIDHQPNQQKTTREAIAASALILRSLMEQRRWDTIDHLVVTSAFLPPIATNTLSALGFNPQNISHQDYRLACAGAVAAFIDTLANLQLKEKRVAIIAAEPLTGLFHPLHFSLQHAAIPGIFGNKYAGIGFIPNDFELVAAQTLIIPDGGTIKIKGQFQLPPHNQAWIPPHYRIDSTAQGMFSASHEGIFTKTEEPEVPLPVTMNGPLTAKFFLRHTPPVICHVVKQSRNIGVNPSVTVLHQPSGTVHEGICRAVKRLDATIPLPPFLLPELGESNSSSATTLVVWQRMLEKDLIRGDEPFLLCAPGIGATIAAAVIQPH